MPGNVFDAIVVGSGISGGWAAKELTEKGLKVLLLERGPNVEHVTGYTNANKPVWEFPHRGNRTQEMIENYPYLKRDYPLNETNLEFWANDQDNPYTEIRRFDWFRGYQLGGRSLTWGRQCYRWSDLDFEANAKEGIAVDWPIRYRNIAPWYSYVEKFAGINGSRENIPHLPDGEFLPAMEMNIAEKDVAARLNKHYNGTRTMIIGRSANLTESFHNRTICQYRDLCWRGCPYGAYFSTQSSTLPAAVATNNLTFRPHSIVTKVIYDKDKKRAKGVEVLDAETNQTSEHFSRIVFLCASTLNSTWVLLNSATDVWPEGLGSSSGALGRYLMDHQDKVGAAGIVPGFEDKYYYGRRPNGIYIPRFQNLAGDKRKYLRGFGYQGSASRQNWQRNIAELSVGAELKEALSEPGPWRMGLHGYGEVLPYHENRVTLDHHKKDKWGLPVLAFDAGMYNNEYQMREDMKNEAALLLEAGGLTDVVAFDDPYFLGLAKHEMGTARMGRDPKTSVLNAHNQLWDAPNVFVTDGACMTSASCVNPSLTYMALTARAADYAVSELKKMNLG